VARVKALLPVRAVTKDLGIGLYPSISIGSFYPKPIDGLSVMHLKVSVGLAEGF